MIILSHDHMITHMANHIIDNIIFDHVERITRPLYCDNRII